MRWGSVFDGAAAVHC